jgi:hypothetical protein
VGRSRPASRSASDLSMNLHFSPFDPPPAAPTVAARLGAIGVDIPYTPRTGSYQGGRGFRQGRPWMTAGRVGGCCSVDASANLITALVSLTFTRCL